MTISEIRTPTYWEPPQHKRPASPICSFLAGQCFRDIRDSIVEFPNKTKDTERRVDAVFKGIGAPFACAHGGGNIAQIPVLLEVTLQLVTAIRFAIDSTPLGVVSRVAGFIGFGYCIIDTARTFLNIGRVIELRKQLNFSDKDKLVENLEKLLENYFDLKSEEQGKGLDENYHQDKYYHFVNRVRPHIAEKIFIKEVEENGKTVKKITDEILLNLIQGVKEGNPEKIKEAENLLRLIDVQTQKSLLYYCISIIILVLTIIALSFSFAGCHPIAIIILMNAAIALSVANTLLWYCTVEIEDWGFEIPKKISSTCTKIKTWAANNLYSCKKFFLPAASKA